MMKVQRRSVVDQPERIVPQQEVRIACSAIDVASKCVEPDDARCKHRIDIVNCNRIVVERSLEVSQADIHSMARAEDILYLRITLGTRKRCIELDDRKVRDRQRCLACEQSNDQFGNERASALSGTAKLCDEQPTTVGIEHRR